MKVKSHIIYCVVIVVLLIVISLPKNPPNDVVIIPSVEGGFDRDSTQLKPIYRDSIVYKYKYKDSIIEIPSQTNLDLLSKYEKAKDSIDRLNLYIDIIQSRKYVERFTDDNIDITVGMTVTGKLDKVTVDYQTKEREIVIPRNPIRVRGGLDADFTRDGFKLTPKISLEDRRHTIYTIRANKEDISFGVQAEIFKIR